MGLCINRFSKLADIIGRTIKKNSKHIADADGLRSYLGLLCLGKSDYKAITQMHDDQYFYNALDIGNIPSTETLRQRLDSQALDYQRIAEHCSIAAYLGLAEWCLDIELRPGNQHSQEGFILGYLYNPET
ncbi:MAG: hypothetical protein CSA33_00330 [Desulfobulbus propionicus]|nr:MAG: hypothetical protein CSA33_00330 [Desulfobulbus propionicus]